MCTSASRPQGASGKFVLLAHWVDDKSDRRWNCSRPGCHCSGLN